MDQISSQYLLEMKNISKSFSGVRALDNADFYLKKGEVHVLMGANGAGKSTLMKILSGCYEKDKGKILIDGNEVNIKTTKDAQQHGIAIIHQHFSQVPHLSVAENIFLGREKLQGVCIDYDYLYENANELLNLMDVHNIDVKEKLIQLSISQKQIIEIAKALSFNSKILIMDEPTSALTKKETAVLFALIRNLVSRGVGIIYISHRIDELNQIGDRVTVMKDGKIVGTKNVKDVGIHELVKMMVGKEIDFIERKNNDTSDFKTRKILLELKNVCVRKTGLKNISFKISEGEIVGLYGLMGAGKTEIARAIFGIDKITSGALFINGKETEINSPKEAIKQGLGFLTEDRLKNGLALSMSVSENMTLPGLKKIIRNGILGLRLERDVVRATVEKLNIKTASIKAKVKNLSGGNQQKVVFGKWIFADSKVLILDEPTQGIDVGAVEEVHKVILDYSKKNNNGILLISSEINEIVQLADRILIVYDGEIIGEMDGAKAVKERIMETAFAGKKVTEVV